MAVLYAILVVFTGDGVHAAPAGAAESLPRATTGVAAPTHPPPAWAELPVAARPEELGAALAPAVTELLASSRPKLARCAELERRSAVPAASPPAPAAAAELVLSLVTRSGAVHVEAVEVRTPGSAPELADCGRRLLPGEAYPAPTAPPGRRHRLAVSL